MEKESKLSPEIPDSPEVQGRRWLENQKRMLKEILGGVFSLKSTDNSGMTILGKISGAMLAALSTKFLLFSASESPVRDPEVGNVAKLCLGTLIGLGITTFAVSVMDSMESIRKRKAEHSEE